MSFARRIARSEQQNYIYQSRSQKFAREVAQARGCRTAQSRIAGPGFAKLGQGRKGGAEGGTNLAGAELVAVGGPAQSNGDPAFRGGQLVIDLWLK